jgi:hypothetical protein
LPRDVERLGIGIETDHLRPGLGLLEHQREAAGATADVDDRLTGFGRQGGEHGGTPPLLPRPQADRAIIVFRRSGPEGGV